MGANISCPACRRLLQMPDDCHGREVRCPECQTTFVGAPTEAITAAAPRPAPSAAAVAVQPGRPAAAWSDPPPPYRDAPGFEGDVLFLAKDLIHYRPSRHLALAVKVMLGCYLGVTVVMLGSNVLHYSLVTRFAAGEQIPDAVWDRTEDWGTMLSVVSLLLYFATALVFIGWFHRAYANLKPLGARGLQYSSGWAIGAWFVPFLNLIRPVQIAQEIWRHSDPQAIARNEDHQAIGKNSTLIGFWWAVWLINGVIGHIAYRLSRDAQATEAILSATLVCIIANIVAIIETALAMAVVSAIQARQTERYEAMRDADQSFFAEAEGRVNRGMG